ncbi:hypothetical protein COM13_21215 [Bacillus pseudomycoides]|nr:hypothetical protein COO07_14705 [Bacillus pseudomycoides]PGB84786.1 hypothetical protein COM13_21215 [Bacillus pseudomycoides]
MTSATTRSLQAANLQPGGKISQSVPVDEGCCYTLSFAASVRANTILVASVTFPGILGSCPSTPEEIANSLSPGNSPIPHIVPAGNQPQSLFQHYTLVVCVPSGATTACITFQNLEAPASVNDASIDNVVFQPTGGGCDGCVQNFI